MLYGSVKRCCFSNLEQPGLEWVQTPKGHKQEKLSTSIDRCLSLVAAASEVLRSLDRWRDA